MNIAAKIAFRYLKSRKSAQAVNIVAWISLSAIAVSATAMLVLFSVFNGFENLIKSMYQSFYPDMQVSVQKGKFFTAHEDLFKNLDKNPNIAMYSFVLEDMAMVEGVDHQKVVSVKGIDNKWFEINNISDFMKIGKANWPEKANAIPAIVGLDIAYELGLDITNQFEPFTLYYPNPKVSSINAMNLSSAMNSVNLIPSGAFMIQQEFDSKYILVPTQAAQQLVGVNNQTYTHVDIKLKNPKDITKDAVKQSIVTDFGSQFVVKNRFEQNQALYMIMNSERWAIYGILTLVLVIASFNMVGSLSMLAIEKKADISILKSMGASPHDIFKIFLYLGIMLSGFGAIIGIILGTIICLLQIQFGFISMGGGFVIDAYPVHLHYLDYIIVIGTAMIIGLLASYFPARSAAKQAFLLRDE